MLATEIKKMSGSKETEIKLSTNWILLFSQVRWRAEKYWINYEKSIGILSPQKEVIVNSNIQPNKGESRYPAKPEMTYYRYPE